MRREPPAMCLKVLNAFSSNEPPRQTIVWLPILLTPHRSAALATVQKLPETRTPLMVQVQQLSSPSKQRSERRIAVRLPLKVRGRDRRGVIFEEETSSENLCRGGAAFVTRFDVAIGSDLEICIPKSQFGARRKEKEVDFATQGRVVHVRNADGGDNKLVGVQFMGKRFRRLFQPETGA